MNIGQTVYETICKAAERGEKITKVVLPSTLYLELVTEPGMERMLKSFGVSVASGTLKAPRFYKKESK